MSTYNQLDSFMYRTLTWSKGAGGSSKTRSPASPVSGSTATSEKLAATPTAFAGNDSTKTLLSNLESGHSSLEGPESSLMDNVAATGINWTLLVGVAGLVLTLFWILRKG